MRKKILVMPDGNWLSHTSRPFEIAKVLREQGHDVIFAGDGHYMKLPRDEGFQVLPIVTINPDRVLACSRRGRANWYRYRLIEQCVDEELELFKVVKPDLVLTDFRLPLSTSCELAGVPLAVVLNAAWTDYYAVRIRAPEHLGVTRVLGKRLTSKFIPWIKNCIITVDARPFNKYRRERGLPERKNIWDIWRGDLNLIADIPDYGPTRNLPDNYHYIGPIVWEPDLEPPAWLEKLDSKRPTIYFSMGSTGYARFFEQAIELFRDTDYQCVMTTAGMVTLSDVPDNFYVVDYAPGSKIMEKSDVVVCHGGNGTIYQAMAKGTPIIGIPAMHGQEFNLDRVVDLGIGIHLSELKFKPSHLRAAVDQVLADTTYKTNANRYREILSQYNGPRTGADLINRYLN
jgi:UDP:flavonoid glycosyltransferase YjiC (YdhE family)